jgi:hypothetical protein
LDTIANACLQHYRKRHGAVWKVERHYQLHGDCLFGSPAALLMMRRGRYACVDAIVKVEAEEPRSTSAASRRLEHGASSARLLHEVRTADPNDNTACLLT